MSDSALKDGLPDPYAIFPNLLCRHHVYGNDVPVNFDLNVRFLVDRDGVTDLDRLARGKRDTVALRLESDLDANSPAIRERDSPEFLSLVGHRRSAIACISFARAAA